MKSKAIIYARLSREDEEKFTRNKSESRSIENQIKVLSEYAQKHEIEIYKIYYDDGVSGGTFDRPGFNNVIKAMKKGAFNVLLLKDFSRLGRVMHRVGDLIENIFPKYNIRVISLGDNYDSATYSSEVPIVLKNFLNEYYLKEVKKKNRLARVRCANTVHLNYYPKFGYRFDENRKPVIDPISAGIVRRVFDLIGNKGYTLMRVAEIFNSEKVPTRSYYATEILKLKPLHKKPATEWNGEKIWEIARDYEYCGHAVNWENHPKEERIILKNTHPALVDEDLFMRTQEVIEKRSRFKHYRDHIGRMLIDRGSGRHLFYAKGKGKTFDNTCYFFRVGNCWKYKILASVIEEVLYQDVIKIIELASNDQERLYKIFKQKLFGRQECSMEKLQKRLDDLNEEYSELLEQYFLKKIPQHLFETNAEKLKSKIRINEQSVENFGNIQIRLSLYEIKFKKFLEALKTKPDNRLEIIRMAIEKVYIEEVIDRKNFKITIVYKFEEV